MMERGSGKRTAEYPGTVAYDSWVTVTTGSAGETGNSEEILVE